MKTLNILIFLFTAFTLHAQSPLYLNFVMHNEESDKNASNQFYDQSQIFFNDSRAVLKEFADTIVANSAAWNCESDWRFLDAVIKWDAHTGTGNQNIIEWLNAQNGIEIDPHAHQTSHNYADVAYLIDSCGVTPSNNVGGFLYDTIVGGHNWCDMQNGMTAQMPPFHVWHPDVLWGGGSMNHGNDLNDYGAWKPDTLHNFYQHNASRHLIFIGNGCAPVLSDTSDVSNIVNQITTFVNYISTGMFPINGFYCATIMTNLRDMNSAGIQKVSQVIHQLQPLIDSGKIVWANTTNKKDAWVSIFNSQPFQLSCGQMPNDVQTVSNEKVVNIFPNPSDGNIAVSLPNISKSNASIKIYTITGQIVFEKQFDQLQSENSLHLQLNLTNGLYFCQWTDGTKTETQKILIQN